MPLPEVDLYLPISRQVLDQIINDGADNLEAFISNSSAAQVASLLLLQRIAKSKGKQSICLERDFAGAINAANAQSKREGLSSLKDAAVTVLNFKNMA